MPPEYTQFGVAGLFVFGLVYAAKIIGPALVKAASTVSQSMKESTSELKNALEKSDLRHGNDLDKMLTYFAGEQVADANARHAQANAIMNMVAAFERAGIQVSRADLLGLTRTGSTPESPQYQNPQKST